MKGETEVQIDWSQAPAKATHCHAPSGEWVRVDGSRVSVWHPSVGLWHTSVVEQPRLTEDEGFYQRPVRWNGEGLPPLGTVCEMRDSDAGTWEAGEVRYISHLIVVMRYKGQKGNIEEASEAKFAQFRPLRTPEQIAAEARQEQIDQILADAGVTGSAFDGDPEAEVWAAALLDAGYRKVEGAP